MLVNAGNACEPRGYRINRFFLGEALLGRAITSG